MNRSSSFVLPFLLACFSLPLMAAGAPDEGAPNQGHGRVSMQGSIIDTPCAIAVESREQAIELFTIPVEKIIRDGAGPLKAFSINLVNCVLQPVSPNRSEWSNFKVTFDGPVTEGNLFALHGGARGVGLEITDSSGNRIWPGIPLQGGSLKPGSMRLDYTLRLVGNHQQLRAGAYHSTVRFKLDYY